MELLDALKLLDTDIKEGHYGKKIIVSKSLDDLWLFNSHYGLCTRSRDWPTPHTIRKIDIEAKDWELLDDV